MSRLVGRILGLAVALALASSRMAFGEVEIQSKAVKIKLTGREHTQFNTTSVEGQLGSEFLIRRARITAEVKLNDLVSGKVQPDFGSGKISLKDAYMKLHFSPNFQIITGQFKRPFDLFELTSSTRILVVERAGKIRGASGFHSFSSLTEGLRYSDRDVGAKATIQASNKRFRLDVAVTNGQGANKVPSKLAADNLARIGEKQYTARASVKPLEARDLRIAGGFTALPIAQPDTAVTSVADLDVEYSTAFEAAAEWGNFKKGLHVQAGFVIGDNWRSSAVEPPTFTAVQGILTYKHLLTGQSTVTAVEPLLRVSWADPDTDAASDAGLLLTPGVQAFFIGRNKVSVNADIFIPESDDLDTETSIKAQMYVHF
ncbi:MAG: porin [Candidatus Krumholzibacteriia bacterium]